MAQSFSITIKKRLHCEWIILTVDVLDLVTNVYKAIHSLHSPFINVTLTNSGQDIHSGSRNMTRELEPIDIGVVNALTLAKHSKTAFDKRKYDEVIKLITHALQASSNMDKIPEVEIILRSIRAAAFGMNGNFEMGHSDVNELFKLNPTSLTGYICSAQLYLQQGHNHLVIESCKKGLQYCAIQGSLMPNMEQEQLIQLELNAKEKQQRHIDFISHLPLEILPDIFSAFSSENLAAFTLVSPIWHTRIVQCTPLWESLKLKQKDEMVWLVLPNVAQHVRNLVYVKSISGSAKTKQDTDQGIFSKETYHDAIDTTYVKHRFMNELPFDFIFTTFSNLKRVELLSTSSWVRYEGFQQLSTLKVHQQLATLKLQWDETGLNRTHLEAIIRACPSLRNLTLWTCNWNILKVGQQPVIPLDVLVINLGSSSQLKGSRLTLHNQLMEFNKTAIRKEQQQHNMSSLSALTTPPCLSTKGLRSFSVAAEDQLEWENRDAQEVYDISPIIIANQHTLEELIIVCMNRFQIGGAVDGIISSIDWSPILTTQFNNLQRFSCTVPDLQEHAIAAFIQRCEQLVDCSLSHPTTIAPIILNTLASKAKLRRLILKFGGTIDLQAFKSLLEDNGKGLNGIEHICFKSCLCMFKMSNGMHHSQHQQQLLNIIATTKSALRGLEIDDALFSFNTLSDWVFLLGRQHSNVEWMIFDNVWCYEYYDIDYKYEWRLGEHNERQNFATRYFRRVPSTAGTNDFIPDTVAFIRSGKHNNLDHSIKKDGYFVANTIYPFLGKQLHLI